MVTTRVQTFPCTEQYRAMAFAQLTFRESLRDIETCLSAQPAKLLHMGFRGAVRRSTLADANEVRDWRIYVAFAQRLIAQARRLYAGESLLGELDNTVYALDSTTIDLCLSLFPWAHFRTTKAAVKMHTLLDLRGNIPNFIHISDGKLHDVHALDMILPEAGAIYVMDRGYVDFARLYRLHQAGAFFVTRAKSNLNAHRVYSAATDRTTGVIADQKIALDGHYTSQDYPVHIRRVRFRDPRNRKDACVPDKSNDPAGVDDMRPVQKPLAGGYRPGMATLKNQGVGGFDLQRGLLGGTWWAFLQSRPNPRGGSASANWSTRSRSSSMASRRSASAPSARLSGRFSRHC